MQDNLELTIPGIQLSITDPYIQQYSGLLKSNDPEIALTALKDLQSMLVNPHIKIGGWCFTDLQAIVDLLNHSDLRIQIEALNLIRIFFEIEEDTAVMIGMLQVKTLLNFLFIVDNEIVQQTLYILQKITYRNNDNLDDLLAHQAVVLQILKYFNSEDEYIAEYSVEIIRNICEQRAHLEILFSIKETNLFLIVKLQNILAKSNEANTIYYAVSIFSNIASKCPKLRNYLVNESMLSSLIRALSLQDDEIIHHVALAISHLVNNNKAILALEKKLLDLNIVGALLSAFESTQDGTAKNAISMALHMLSSFCPSIHNHLQKLSSEDSVSRMWWLPIQNERVSVLPNTLFATQQTNASHEQTSIQVKMEMR